MMMATETIYNVMHSNIRDVPTFCFVVAVCTWLLTTLYRRWKANVPRLSTPDLEKKSPSKFEKPTRKFGGASLVY
jgi:hypothetical protein